MAKCSFNLPQEHLEAFRQQAAAAGLPYSELLRGLVTLALASGAPCRVLPSPQLASGQVLILVGDGR